MNIRYFSEYSEELTRDEAVKDLVEGNSVTVAYRSRTEDIYANYVTAYGRHFLPGPKVSWSAPGAVPPGEATAYAALITEAAKIAGEAI